MTAEHRHHNTAGKWITAVDGGHTHPELETRLTAFEARLTAFEARLTKVEAVPATPQTPTPSIPTLADVPGWMTVLDIPFDIACAEGGFALAYPDLKVYPVPWTDTRGVGHYNPGIVSVAGGIATIRIRSINGVPQVFAMTAMPPGFSALGGALRWRVETVIRSDRIPGYKMVASMGWSDRRSSSVLVNGVDMGSDYVKWLDGEIDVFEANLDGSTMKAYLHYPDVKISVDSVKKTVTPLEVYQESADLGVNLDQWHVATTEYVSADHVDVLVDGVSKRRFTNRVPYRPFHHNWQFETNLSGTPIDPTVAGNIQIAHIRVSVPTA